MEKDYFTIAEAAALAGVSTQAVYKRLTTSLQPYVATVEGRKVLKAEGLDVLLQPQVDNPVTNLHPPVDNPLQVQDSTLKLLEKTIDTLQEQLKVKDDQLKAKDDHIKALNDRLEQALTISSQGNFLMAQEKQRQIIEPAPEKSLPWYKRIFKK